MTVPYIGELLAYDFGARTVTIRVVLLVSVASSCPVYLHCVHRRCVQITDATTTIANPSDLLGMVAARLGSVEVESEALGGHRVRFCSQDGKSFCAHLPDTCPPDFAMDQYSDSLSALEIPFSSARLGPLAYDPVPHLLAISIVIAGASFDRLIGVFENGLARYVYSIEGPEIVSRDIEALDLYGMRDPLRTPYQRVYDDGIRKLRVPIDSYDVITCDAPTEAAHYVRQLSRVVELRTNERMIVQGKRFLINAWHSDTTDFMISRVSLTP